ncbi:unnamed protein product, partial [Allacma fusca]
ISIFLSWVSLGWSMTKLDFTIRSFDNEALTIWGKASLFPWHFCMIASRVCTLAFLAATLWIWILPCLVVHCLIALIWINCGTKDLSLENKCRLEHHPVGYFGPVPARGP